MPPNLFQPLASPQLTDPGLPISLRPSRAMVVHGKKQAVKNHHIL